MVILEVWLVIEFDLIHKTATGIHTPFMRLFTGTAGNIDKVEGMFQVDASATVGHTASYAKADGYVASC